MASNSFIVKKSLGFNPQANPPANPVAGDVYLSTDGNLYQYSSGAWRKLAGGATAFDVAQTAHAFPVLTAIYHNGTTWVAARADDQDTLSTHIVVEVIDANNFVAANFGKYTVTGHGKTVGQYYFLSSTVAGESSTAEPASPDFSCPLFYVQDADTIHALVYRPSKVDADGYLGANKYDAVTTASQTVFNLGFWVNLDAKNSFDFYYDGVLLKEGVGFDYTLTNVVNNHSNQVTLAVAATVGKNVQAVYRGIYEQIDSMPNPMTTEGDIIRGGTSGTPTRVAIGALGSLLRSNGTTPAWNSSIYVAADGKVGIGNTSPNLPLVVGANGNAAAGALAAFNTANVAILNTPGQVVFGATNSIAANIGGSIGFSANGTIANYPTGSIHGKRENATASNYASYMAFTTSDAAGTVNERMRIDSSGKILIGTTTASSALINVNGNVTIGSGTAANPSYCFTTADNTGMYYPGSGILGFSASGAERMRIDASGNVGIGASPTYKLDVQNASATNYVVRANNTTGSGNVKTFFSTFGSNGNSTNSEHFRGETAGVGNWFLFGNGTHSFTSDERRKKNIETTRDGYLQDLCQLRVVKYNWKVDEDGTPKELGLIAQEVEQIFPGLIKEDNEPAADGIHYKGIKNSVIPYMLLKAIQELSSLRSEDAAKIASLESALTDVVSRLSALEQQ
jgi:hypothetical protein